MAHYEQSVSGLFLPELEIQRQVKERVLEFKIPSDTPHKLSAYQEELKRIESIFECLEKKYKKSCQIKTAYEEAKDNIEEKIKKIEEGVIENMEIGSLRLNFARFLRLTGGVYLSYDDLGLNQSESSVRSRSEIDTKTIFGDLDEVQPVCLAPMDTVTSEESAREISRLGGFSFYPRVKTDASKLNTREELRFIENSEFRKNLELCRKFTEEGVKSIFSIGANYNKLDMEFERARRYKEAGAKMILIDTANGGLDHVIEFAKKIQEELGLKVVLGNICSIDVAKKYIDAGIEYIRVGIGPGAACTTRAETGVGVAQFATLKGISEMIAREYPDKEITLIADGGHNTSKGSEGFCKAMAANGAKNVKMVSMFGGAFAATKESPGRKVIMKVDVDGKIIKKKQNETWKEYFDRNHGDRSVICYEFRGQASASYNRDIGKGDTSHIEGKSGWKPRVKGKSTVEEVMNFLLAGLRSSMSYAGAKRLEEFAPNASLFLRSPASAKENGTRI